MTDVMEIPLDFEQRQRAEALTACIVENPEAAAWLLVYLQDVLREAEPHLAAMVPKLSMAGNMKSLHTRVTTGLSAGLPSGA